jgi:hypothetical protein
MAAPLLDLVRGLIERTYGMRPGLGDLAPFIIGDGGWSRLYAERRAESAGSASGDGARILLRQTPEGLAACVYFPDSMIRRLEAEPPQRGLSERNLAACATFVEEIDHLLLVAERFHHGRPVSLFELELHANVTKHLVLSRLLAGPRARLTAAERLWLRRRLYGGRFCDSEESVRQRYHDARRYAVRLIDGLARRVPRLRLELLRRFHRLGAADQVQLIEHLAA